MVFANSVQLTTSLWVFCICKYEDFNRLKNPINWFIQTAFETILPPVIALTFFYKPRNKKVNPLLKAPKNEFGVAEAALQLSACSQSEYNSS